jgi:hypothetical protein
MTHGITAFHGTYQKESYYKPYYNSYDTAAKGITALITTHIIYFEVKEKGLALCQPLLL